MNEYDELMDGAGIDAGDEAARREALHDQLRMDAALTAYFGGGEAEASVRRSVLAMLQSCGDRELQRRVMLDPRLRHPARRPRRWVADLALVAAAVALSVTACWWLLLVPPSGEAVAEQSPRPEIPAKEEIPAPIVRPPVKAIAKDVVHAPLTPALIEEPRKAAPPPRASLPVVVAVSPAPAMPERKIGVVNAPAMIVAKPDADIKPSLGTPPAATMTPQMGKGSTERDPALWPFSAGSPWNIPIGSDAKLEVIVPAEFAEQTIGFQPRTIYRATPQIPLARFKRPRGAAVKMAFAREWAETLDMHSAPVTVIEPDGHWAVEYYGLTRNGDDWNVTDISRYSLLEDGVGRDGRGVSEYGIPALAGVIRSGEWQNGIPHAISLIVPVSLLNAKAGGGKSWSWPALPEQAPDTSGFAKRGNLHIGSLLALPSDAHPSKLGLTEGTPQYHLALALWEHGARIVGGSKEGRIGISLLTETLASGRMERDALARIFARLQVVANSSATRPGGGGTPRCSLAPAFNSAK